MMRYEILKILQTIATNKPYALTAELWEARYSGLKLIDWDWSELDIWVKNMPKSETKTKLVKSAEVFKAHKITGQVK